MSAKDAILLDAADQVATVLQKIQPGETVRYRTPKGDAEVIAAEMIPIFHKIAVRPMPTGSDVLKYGDVIGVLSADVEAGALVHVHNLRSKRAIKAS